jgi:thioredoxin-dependent peroxiredoxin
VNIGDAAPTFDVQTDTGARFSLRGVLGRWVIVWFFPESESISTDTQARGFEKLLESFIDLNAVIVGVSIEPREEHIALRSRNHLTYPLCTDRSKAISSVYNVMKGLEGWRGRANRHTFLIDPDGRIAFTWAKVNPRIHAKTVLEVLEKMAIERRVLELEGQNGRGKTKEERSK